MYSRVKPYFWNPDEDERIDKKDTLAASSISAIDETCFESDKTTWFLKDQLFNYALNEKEM